MTKTISLFILALLWLPVGVRVAAQPSPVVPVVAAAENQFNTALNAFEQGGYEEAAALFAQVVNAYDLHQKTTAALLMWGKTLYRAERYNEAQIVLNRFQSEFPYSRYANEAELIYTYAQQVLNRLNDTTITLNIGVLLPLDDPSSLLSQELFNGIHLAIESFNLDTSFRYPGAPKIQAKMFYRDTQNDPDLARESVRMLISNDNVDVIIGPLFSEEAEAAASEAERYRMVMIAPLATSEAVSNGKYHVFQANPSLRVRGKQMARFAIRSLGMDNLGLIYDRNSAEARNMANGFEEEVFNSPDAVMRFKYIVQDTRNWFRLSQQIISDSLGTAQGVYLPMSGSNASQIIGGTLGSLDRMDAPIRILGNVEWHNLPLGTQASKYGTTYSNHFYFDEANPETQFFMETYRDRFASEPGRLAFTGHDVTQYILSRLVQKEQSGDQLVNLIRQSGPFQGLGIRMDFLNGNINEALFYHRYRNAMPELLR